jgi:hypothetical protein
MHILTVLLAQNPKEERLAIPAVAIEEKNLRRRGRLVDEGEKAVNDTVTISEEL